MIKTQPRGYVALITVAVIMSAMIVVGITVTLLVATGVLTSFTNDQGERAFFLADSCAHEALLQLKRDGMDYVGSHTLTVDVHTCTIEVSAISADTVEVEVIGNYNDTAYRSMYLEVDTDPFTVNSWQETN